MEFWKQYCVPSLNSAFLSGDVKEICQAVLLSAMNEDSRVILRTSITAAIARLTNKTPRSIQKALQELEKLNFGRLEKKNVYIVSHNFASKSKYPVSTGFGIPYYSKEFESFLAEFEVLFRSQQAIRRIKEEDEDMNALIKTLSKQLETKDQQLEHWRETVRARDEQIMGLIKLAEVIAKGGHVSAEEARKHLTLVKK